jgi:hypothetical protein
LLLQWTRRYRRDCISSRWGGAPLTSVVKPLGFCIMGTLQQLQQWYQSHCDGEWEHSYGVVIGTLDNPGWSVRIDLVATPLAARAFTEVKRLENETNWIRCCVREGKFEGHGGPFMLEEILRIFLTWATESQTV